MQLRKPRGLGSELSSLEHELLAALGELGYDGGQTAADADSLKLELMGGSSPAGYGEGSGPVAGRLEITLEDLADRYGSGCVFRQLERFALFCSRMRFAKPGSGVVSDDPKLPVYPWCRTNGRSPATDLAEAAELHQQWYEEAMRQFQKEG